MDDRSVNPTTRPKRGEPGYVSPMKGRRSAHVTDEHIRKMIEASRETNTRPIADRFWEKVDKSAPGGCWQWLGANNRERPVLWSGGKDGRALYAHRLVFELMGFGKIPEGLFVDHACRNGMCVNPDHLRAVTPRINSLENNESPMAKLAKLTHCRKCGNPYAGENLALYTPPRKKTRHGHPTTPKPQRKCLTCFPHYWRWAVIPRDPPPGARRPFSKLLSEGHSKP